MSLHVLFKVGEAEYAIPAAEVLQMESFEGATPVPGAAPYVAGLVQVRGKVVPVIDLRRRFGLQPLPLTLDARIIVGQVGDRAVALQVDAAREVINLRPEDIRPPPPAVSEEAGGLVRAVAQVGKRLVMLIEFTKIVGEENLHGDQRREELAGPGPAAR